MKSALENATNDLKKMKSDYDEQRLNIEIIQAEKESLEAEKKTLEVKFNEITLKLKKKTNQYDSLLKSQQKRAQTIKEEPKEIGIVNIPSSSSSQKVEPAAKTGTKRTCSSKDDVQRTKAKRKKTAKTDSTSHATKKSPQIFSCSMCLYTWGMFMKRDYLGELDDSYAPDPKEIIPTFQSFQDYKDHYSKIHSGNRNMCKEKSCLNAEDHSLFPHGDIRCNICSLSFKLEKDHDDHMRFEHVDLKPMSTIEIYNLFLESEKAFDGLVYQ